MREMALPMTKATLDVAASSAIPFADQSASRANSPTLFPLEVQGLCFDAGGRRLIDNLDLTLSASGTTMIMGPNGAGKSVLLRLIHGLLQPSSGSIKWSGKPPSEVVRRKQALVFQKPVLLRRSVAENVDFVLRTIGSQSVEHREQLLDRVGLLSLSKQPARLLSGGEQQRLSLARALALSPEVLLLDEPTASLDPASVLKIEQIVADAVSHRVKVIFITHDLGQARRLATDVVFLHRGKVAEHAPAETFFECPDSEAVRDFLAGRIVL